jgi:site-specific DNA-methyltransferase (adenine-specific)
VWVVNDGTVNGGKSLSSFRQAIYFQEIGFTVHDTMIWNKGCFTSPQSNRYPDVFEYMFVLSKGSPKTYNLLTDRKNVSSGKFRAQKRTAEGTIKEMYKSATHKEYRSMGVRFNVWEMPPEQSNINRLHPAQFAERLAQDHILSWSNENDVVLDCFCGSGTTPKMAKVLSRHYIGIEISQEYISLAEKRLLATNVPLFGLGRGLTPREPDNGDSAPSQAFSQPEFLSDLESLS